MRYYTCTEIPMSERIVKPKEQFRLPEIKCWTGDDKMFDSFKERETGDFVITEHQDIKILGGHDVTVEHRLDGDFFAAPGDPRNFPSDISKIPTTMIDEAICIFHCVNCWGHFLLEFLPMFTGLDYLKAEDDRFQSLPVLTSNLPFLWQQKIASNLEANDYLTPCRPDRIYHIKKAYNLSRPHNSVIPKWVPEILKSRFVKTQEKATKRIYVSRKNVMHARRQLANYDEVLPVLKEYGFEEIHPQSVDIFKQAEIFSSAKIVFGIHGSGNLNFAFCNRDSILFEIIPTGWPCHYGMATCVSNSGSFHYMTVDGEQESNLVVDCAVLRKALNEII